MNRNLSIISAAAFFSFLLSSQVIAANQPSFRITGTIESAVEIKPTTLLALSKQPNYKPIKLLKVELSEEAKKYLAEQAGKPNTENTFSASNYLPSDVQLGMNGVPVLDQGAHGTCVTFADTAAVDAIIGQDYISQLCNLELGAYLENKFAEKNVKYPSGWDGSLNEIVLKQMQDYGIISVNYQNQYGCGDDELTSVKAYPRDNAEDTGVLMSDVNFRKHSEMVFKDLSWRIVLNAHNAFTTKSKMITVLNNVKQALNKGNRIVFGTLVDVNGNLNKTNGAVGNYHNVKNVAWILTPEIINDAKIYNINAGHAMVITGYDDHAVIEGPNKTKHTGVLTLRNSWSESAGDNGTYYMSYDYFKLLALEVEEISGTPLA